MEANNVISGLKSAVGTKTPLADIVNAFCEKCTSAFSCAGFVFDTGIYEMTCDELFCLSLICEYKDDCSKNGAIHIEIAYPPRAEIYELSCKKQAKNAPELKEIIFSSKEYDFLKDKNALKISIFCD